MTQIKMKGVYNYTARMHDAIICLKEDESNIKDFNVRLTNRNEMNESLHFLRAHLKKKSNYIELYHLFFNEILISGSIEGIDVIEVVKQVDRFLRYGESENIDSTLNDLKSLSAYIGDTYNIIEDEDLDKVRNTIKALHKELRSLNLRKDRDPTLGDLGFISKFYSNIITYNELGFDLCQSKTETSLILFLGKLKLMSDRYDNFRNNNKILALIIDLISLLSSFGLLTGLIGIGQSIVKLFPNSEHLTEAKIEDIVKLVDVS